MAPEALGKREEAGIFLMNVSTDFSCRALFLGQTEAVFKCFSDPLKGGTPAMPFIISPLLNPQDPFS